MKFSNAPMSVLCYLSSEQTGTILQGATCRTDVLRQAYQLHIALQSLMEDFISCYSPLSAEVGDQYSFVSSQVFSDFGGIGG